MGNWKILQNVNKMGMIMLLLVQLLVLMPASPLHAGPASPNLLTLKNPDGTSFSARIRGDEFQNWIEAENGYSVIRNPKTTVWEYAEKATDGSLRNSGVEFRGGKVPPSTIQKGLRPDKNTGAAEDRNRMIRDMYQQRLVPLVPKTGEQGGAGFEEGPGDWDPVPVSGTRKMLVILINFADRTLSTTSSGWSGTIFDATVGVKSMARFFTENSYGTLTVSPAPHSQAGNPTGIITVAVADNHPNFGGGFNFSAEVAVLNHALTQAASFINFDSYDTNGNGLLEQSELSIYFIYAGYEASGSSKTPSIWAHATYTTGTGLTAGTKNVQRWAQNGELNDSDAQHPMGVIAHEMGHALCGFPDLYDTSGTNAGLGLFSLMASGSWGADIGESGGMTPVTLDAWSRQYVGWATPLTASSNGSISLPLPLSSATSSYKLLNAAVSTSEYFLAENRYPTGWDLGMKGYFGSGWAGGLLILHVDITSGTQGSNDINRSGVSEHQGVMAEEADSTGCSLVNGTCPGSAGILFYNGNNTAFTDSSTPNSRYYSGSSTNIGLSDVSGPAQAMSAFYSFGNVPPALAGNYPDDNQVDVSTSTVVSVIFNKDIDQSTLSGSTFYLKQGSASIPGSISYNSSTRTVTFTPAVQLSMSTVYTATVTTGVTDQNGTPLTAAKSWSFTTGNALLSERFDSTTLPAGWSVVDNAGTGAVWRFNDPGGRTNLTGGSGGFAIADSDFAGEINMDTELRTPVLNLAGYNSASLTFNTDCNVYSGDEVADVDISLNGGTSWTNIWRKTGSDYPGPITETINISQYVGNSNVMVRFHYYNAYFDWWWQVDNVTVNAAASPRTLSVTVSGSGSVNSNPSGISCTSGPCTHTFDPMTSVTLMPTKSVYSTFSGWSGGCSSFDGDNCVVVMNADKAVTAYFTAIQPVYIPGKGYYESLQSAYGDAQVSSVIQAKAVELAGNFYADLGKNATLRGGYDDTFTTNNGFTTLTGNLVVETGSLTVQNLIIN